MIRFSCPKCNAALKLPVDFPANVVACPKCRTPISISQELRDDAMNAVEPVEAVAYRPRRKKKRKNRSFDFNDIPVPLWIAFGINLLLQILGSFSDGRDPGADSGLQRPEDRAQYQAIISVVQWFFFIVLWLAIFMRSNLARLIMKGLLWISIVAVAIGSVGLAVSGAAAEAVVYMVALAIGAGLLLLLSQDSVVEYTNG